VRQDANVQYKYKEVEMGTTYSTNEEERSAYVISGKAGRKETGRKTKTLVSG
jgi:hypothetical protein